MICEIEASWSSVVVVFICIESACLLSRSFPCHRTRKQHAHTDIMGFEHLRPRTPSSCQLGFNANYLFRLGRADVFMSPEEIVDWINSVSSYLQDWYDDVVSKPENKHHLQKVRNNLDAFVKDMHDATPRATQACKAGRQARLLSFPQSPLRQKLRRTRPFVH